ncbi:MAG TPA: homocysteine S-methyltransferase family protein [Levilinea sp.]|nr:homocysteine S-methyltransferase family protein [Levilinea sp.]
MNFLERIKTGQELVSDGAMGTNLQLRGLGLGLPGEVWVLERPDEIVRLHRAFIDAGAGIILTCTFGGSAVLLERAGLGTRMEEINRAAVGLARCAIDGRDVLVAGSIGPLGQLLKPLGPLEPDAAQVAYSTQARVLSEAGVDLLVIETQFDLAEAEAAVRGARSASSLPLVCSFSYDRGTRTMMGVRPAQAGTQMEAWGVDVAGINCGRSLEDNLKTLQELRAATKLPIWFKPNAGMPELDGEGRPTYSVTPQAMGAQVSAWLAAGAQVVGGCCGSSPEHLREIAENAR